jgi:hypothetical protein
MIVTERKSKYKTKITLDSKNTANIRNWCEEQFGPSGRRNRWRFGWTQDQDTFYFRCPADALLFTIKWA